VLVAFAAFAVAVFARLERDVLVGLGVAVSIGGTGVSVDAAVGVSVGGSGVSVGGSGVSVGGTAVSVAVGTGVSVAVGSGDWVCVGALSIAGCASFWAMARPLMLPTTAITVTAAMRTANQRIRVGQCWRRM
jgi:hypothetical protein